MKPTKSILCHRSNSGSSPRAPLNHPVARPSLLSTILLRLLRLLFVACHPSFHPPSRFPTESSLASPPSATTPAESSFLSGLKFSPPFASNNHHDDESWGETSTMSRQTNHDPFAGVSFAIVSALLLARPSGFKLDRPCLGSADFFHVGLLSGIQRFNSLLRTRSFCFGGIVSLMFGLKFMRKCLDIW